MLRKALGLIMGTPQGVIPTVSSPQMSAHRRATKERDLIRKESKIGATLLGKIPTGHHREFFCLDEHTWVWYEEWFDSTEKMTKTMNVHYDFQPRGVLKIVDGIPTGYVVGAELKHLLETIRTYYKRVSQEVYGQTAARI